MSEKSTFSIKFCFRMHEKSEKKKIFFPHSLPWLLMELLIIIFGAFYLKHMRSRKERKTWLIPSSLNHLPSLTHILCDYYYAARIRKTHFTKVSTLAFIHKCAIINHDDVETKTLSLSHNLLISILSSV